MQNNIYRLLCIGDVVGKCGVNALQKNLASLKQKYSADTVIVNGENATDPNGLDTATAKILLQSGADVLTGGNHTTVMREFYDFLDESENALRPCNFPPQCPGKGYTVIHGVSGLRVLVINVSGQVYMPSCDNPFCSVERILKEQAGKYDISVCDIHAEATSEKNAFGIYFDGRINCIFGTHTHIQTADEHILPGGSGYITDIGMTGVAEGTVLGVKAQNVINRFVKGTNEKFMRPESGKAVICGVVFDYDTATEKCVNVTRIKI